MVNWLLFFYARSYKKWKNESKNDFVHQERWEGEADQEDSCRQSWRDRHQSIQVGHLRYRYFIILRFSHQKK